MKQSRRLAEVSTSGSAGAGFIETIAGSAPFQGPVTTLNAGLGGFQGLVEDTSGNLFVSTFDLGVVLKIDPAGNVSVYAGVPLPTGVRAGSGDGGLATAATLAVPSGLALNAVGDLYIAEEGSYAIRMVKAATGIISTVAGTLNQTGYSGDGGLATSAKLQYPASVVLDGAGNLFIGDEQSVRMVNRSTGMISTIAGGDDVNATCSLSATQTCAATNVSLSLINAPSNIAVSQGVLYIAANGLGQAPNQFSGVVSVALNSGTMQLLAGGDGYVGTLPGNTAINADLYPMGVAIDMAGNLDIAASSVIQQLARGGTSLTTIAGTGNPGFFGDGGPAIKADLANPQVISITPAGNLLIGDSDHIRSVNAAGTISTIAGDGTANLFGDGGPARSAGLDEPADVAIDTQGNVYIADQYDNVVRRIDHATGIITTVAGNGAAAYGIQNTQDEPGDGGMAVDAPLAYMNGLTLDNTNHLYISTFYGIRSVDLSSGVISTFLGVIGFGGIVFDGNQTIYASVLEEAQVQVYATNLKDGTTSVVAGAGEGDGETSGDGGPATAAGIIPFGLALDGKGNLYISDRYNNNIRIVNLSSGIIETLAGSETAVSGYTGDGGQASLATLSFPAEIRYDGSGHLLVSDSGNSVIRRIDLTSGIITTVVGNGAIGFTGDGGAPASASLQFPSAATVDANGNIYVADSQNDRVRRVILHPTVLTSMLATSATSLIPGASATITATFSGISLGYAPTGLVNFLDGTTSLGTGTLIASTTTGNYSAVLTDFAFTSGSHVVTAAYAGDSHYAPVTTASVTITVTPAPVVLTAALTASASSVTAGGSVKLKAAFTGLTGGVVPALSSVTFYDGAAVVPANSDTGAVSGNVYTVTLTTTGLAVGAHSLTAKFAGDANYAAVTTGAVVVTVLAPAIPPSFAVTAAPGSLTVAQGGAGTAVFTVTPAGGFTSAVSFSCGSGLPTGVACSFAPASVTPTGTAAVTTTLTVTTTAADEAANVPMVKQDGRWWVSGGVSLACLLMIGVRRRRGAWLMVVFLALAAGVGVGCGSGGSGSKGPTPNPDATPVGTYTLKVAAASGSGSGAVSEPVSVTLVVTQ